MLWAGSVDIMSTVSLTLDNKTAKLQLKKKQKYFCYFKYTYKLRAKTKGNFMTMRFVNF